MNSRNNRKSGVLPVLLMYSILMLSAALDWKVCAQEREELGPPPEDSEDGFKKLESLKLWIITEELNVEEHLAEKLFPRLRELERFREQSMKIMKSAIDDLDRKSHQATVDKSQLEEQIKKIRQLRKEHMAEFEKLQDRIIELLSIEQQARYIVLEDEFPRKIRSFMRHHRGGRYGEGDVPVDRENPASPPP